MQMSQRVLACLLCLFMSSFCRSEQILNRQSDKSLDANSDRVSENGCPIALWDYLGQPQQDWKLIRADGDGDEEYFAIVCRASGLVLDANSDRVRENGCPVQLWKHNGWPNQQWKLVPVAGTDGGFKIVNRASGLVLDAHSLDVHLLNCRVQLWQDLNQPQQIWLIKPNQAAVANMGINSNATNISKRLRVLLICDTTAAGGISDGVKANRDRLLQVIEELGKDRPQRFTVDVIDGEGVSPEAVKQYYNRLMIESGDALFCYYAGHGGWDDSKMPNGFDEKGHYLAMRNGDLYRSELRGMMRQHKATAHFLISDACSSIANVPPPPRRSPADWAGFQNLFFGHSGFYDIQGATRQEFGWYGSEGSIFTGVLTKLMCEPTDRCGWNIFFQRLRVETVAQFKANQAYADESQLPRNENGDIRDSEAQTPEALYLGDWPGSEYSSQ